MRTLLTPRAVRRILGLAMLGLATQAAPAQRPVADAGVVILKDGWEYRWGDSPLDERGVPVWASEVSVPGWQPTTTTFSPPGEAQEFLWLRVRLPEELPDDPMVGAGDVIMNFEAYLDSTRIYQFGKLQPDLRNKYAMVTPQFIPLPEEAQGRMLSLRIFSDYRMLAGIQGAVFLGSEANLLRAVYREDLAQLIIGVILLVVGVFLLLLLVTVRERQQALLLFYLGLFSLCFGLSYVTDSPLSGLVIQSPVVLFNLASALFLFPVGFLGFFEQVIGPGYKNVIRWLLRIHLVFFVILWASNAVSLAFFPVLMMIFFGLLTVSLLVSVVTVIPAIRSGNPEAKIFGTGLCIVVVLGLFDSILQGFLIVPNAPDLAHWGVLIFMLSLGYLLYYRFTENTRQLQAAHAQLEDYSATLEQRVEQRTEELEQSLNLLTEAQDQLIQSEKLAGLGRLTAGIAHEIKNPLNFVNNFAALSTELADELRDELQSHRDEPVADVLDDVQDLLDDLKFNTAKIHEHGQRADSIVKSMMQHARGGEGERRATDVNRLLEEYVNLAYHGMRASTPEFNVTIECNYDEAVGEVEMVPEEVCRVFVNLINNAFYAVHERAQSSGDGYTPTVEVRTRRDGEHVEIRVRDNGTGIPETVRERIFEPFFTTKPTGEGTGLGLSLSYDIVTQGHGGTMTVESEEGEGTTFVMTLPVGNSTR